MKLLLALALVCSPALAEELNFMPPIQPRGEVFAFSGVLSWDDGARILTVQGPWESFLEAVQPQHADFAVLGYVPLYAGDGWSVDYGSGVVLTAPLEVRANPYYSDLIARIKPGEVVSKNFAVSPVPEMPSWALLIPGLYAGRLWTRRKSARSNERKE